MFSPLPVTVYAFAAGSYVAAPAWSTVPTSAWPSKTPTFSSGRAAAGNTAATTTAARTRAMLHPPPGAGRVAPRHVDVEDRGGSGRDPPVGGVPPPSGRRGITYSGATAALQPTGPAAGESWCK